ncbi:hypothetical protein SISNIDRAFT_285392 [Sistotremastrum niveocremeum HHB9708]|uniref:Uncharacterized protein n=1 Tax=Sistotremastrum niveocremeum HHB9708 TaxID=1314777 RepID=A0A164YAW9_9AGAM|nr:hypothetical protein SISNIDRAFT_285392 [Sistotremastrum niveocremeum HHB9708]
MLSATSLSISTEPNAFPFDELDHTDDRATSSSESLDSPATIERRLQPQERSGSNISSINISEFTRVSLNAQHLAHGCRHQDVGHPPSPRARHSLHDLEKVDDDMSNWDQNLSLDHDQHAHACRVIFQTPQSPSHSHHASLADLEEAHLNRTSDYSVQSPTHAQSIETSVPMSRSAPSHCAHEATPSSLEPDPSHNIAHDDSPSCDYQDSGSYNIDSKASYPDPSSYCESGYFSDSHSHPYHNGNATSTPRIFEFNHDTRHTVASYDLTPSSSASSSSSWDSSASDIEEPDLVDIHIQVKIHREHDRIFCSRGTEEWEIHGPELESELEASNSGSSWAREGLGFVDSKRVRAGKGRRDFTASPAHMLPRLSCLSRVRPGQGQGKYGKVSQESSTPDVGQASVSAHACARFEQT